MKRLLPIALLVAGAALVPVAPATAAACSSSSGVTVVVDFDNGDIQVRCATVHAGDNGYAVLRAAGFTPRNVQDGRNGAALCSIDNVPDHTCTSMPPTSEYWAYFHAKPGGQWAYSSYGGGSYYPKPGSVEGWHFRGSPDDPPGIAPPGTASTPAPIPTPKPSSAPSSHPAATSPTSPASHPRGGASVPVVGRDGTPTAAGSPTAAATGPAGSASANATTAPTAGATAGVADGVAGGVAVEAPRRTAVDSSGSRSWIWGVALVLVLAAAAGSTAIRRRRG